MSAISPERNRKPIERGLNFRVRVVAVDVDVDVADAPPLAFVDVIHQLELARLFQKDGFGLDVGEDVALAAVEFLEPGDVGVHLVLLERLRAGRQRPDVVVELFDAGAARGIGLQLDARVVSESLEKILLPMKATLSTW